jgi:hypothetical protein
VGTTTNDDDTQTSYKIAYSNLGRIDVVELGGGRGTNAKLILDHLKEAHPLVYQRVNYIVMDSSPSLLQLQKETLLASVHADRVQFESKDMLDVAEQGTSFLPPSKRPTVVRARIVNFLTKDTRPCTGDIEQAERPDKKERKAQCETSSTSGTAKTETWGKKYFANSRTLYSAKSLIWHRRIRARLSPGSRPLLVVSFKDSSKNDPMRNCSWQILTGCLLPIGLSRAHQLASLVGPKANR